jgi:hypothetical protein
VQRAADDPDAPAARQQRAEDQLVAGRDHRSHVGELPEKPGLVRHGQRAGHEILLVDPRLALHRHAGEDIAGKKRLGEALGLLGVLADAADERQIMLEPLRRHQRGELLLAAGPGMTNPPRRWRSLRHCGSRRNRTAA